MTCAGFQTFCGNPFHLNRTFSALPVSPHYPPEDSSNFSIKTKGNWELLHGDLFLHYTSVPSYSWILTESNLDKENSSTRQKIKHRRTCDKPGMESGLKLYLRDTEKAKIGCKFIHTSTSLKQYCMNSKGKPSPARSRVRGHHHLPFKTLHPLLKLQCPQDNGIFKKLIGVSLVDHGFIALFQKSQLWE